MCVGRAPEGRAPGKQVEHIVCVRRYLMSTDCPLFGTHVYLQFFSYLIILKKEKKFLYFLLDLQ